MGLNPSGTRRYFFEYLFYDAIERTKALTGKPIMISAARKMRRDLDELLQQQNVTFDDWSPGLITEGIDNVLSSIEGYKPLYSEGGKSVAYKTSLDTFSSLIGISGKNAVVTPGAAGPRLPISPYDPQWSNRSTIARAGSQLSYLLSDDIEQLLGGNVARAAGYRNKDLTLYSVTEEGQAHPIGQATSLDDLSGLTRLMRYMPSRNYDDIRSWVLEGSKTDNGYVDTSRFMSREALDRSEAILEYLQETGTPYEIVRDRVPGQIMARITGTKITVRLMDSAADESFIGRIYDDGMWVYFTTNQFVRGTNKLASYTPTATESVDLLKAALGADIERSDGSLVGSPGVLTTRSGGKEVKVQESYYALKKENGVYFPNSGTRRHMMFYKNLNAQSQVFIQKNAKSRSMSFAVFADSTKASDYLEGAVTSAQENIVAALDVDRLIADASENSEDPDFVPEFSGDVEIAAIQRAYWDVLTGKRDVLLRPHATKEEFEDVTEVLAQLQIDDEARAVSTSILASDLMYSGSPEEMVRAHASEVPVGMIGTFEPHEVVDEDGVSAMRRFDPVRVAKYMDSEFGPWRNTSDIISALKTAEITGDELLGDGFEVRSVKDRLLEFDVSSAETIGPEMSGSPVRKRLANEVLHSLNINGIEDVEALIDENGVVSWTGVKRSRSGDSAPVSGIVGQIFDVGPQGDIATRFASGDNFLMVPGYEARIAAQRPGEDLSVEERTMLRGYEQVMAERIRYRIAADLMVQRSSVGETTSLNGVYRSLYDERLPLDFWEKAQERGLGRGWAEAIVGTLSRRVRYPNEMGDTFYEHWARSRSNNAVDLSNDNFDSPLVRSGGRNMVIIADSARGYFDPDMTNGSRMGTTFYLAEGAEVDGATGRIIPSSDLDDRAPLMKHPEMKYADFDVWDRRLMTSSILLHGTRVTEPEKVAFSDILKGWTADDGIIVSQEFANKNTMLTRDGTSRPLVVGDKVADMHGNKGVVGLIVDPNMPLDEAKYLGIDKAVQLFSDNPELSVVMSPFSGVSRYNGGSAREILDGQRSDLVLPDGEVVSSGVGSIRFIVTNKDVEAGTRFYDDAAIAKGSGRRASAQLAWILGGKDAKHLMADFYGANSSAVANLREYLVFMGLDMDPEGTFLPHRQAETSAQRRILEMPETILTTAGTINTSAMRKTFSDLISNQGGDLLLPFSLELANGDQLEAFGDKFRLPVLSSHLRTGQEFDDGSVVSHDYTNQYMNIYQAAYRYNYALEQLAKDGLSPTKRATMEEYLTSSPRRAQAAYSAIARSIKERQFAGKHNIFRDGVMSSRLPNSATAVWTADPRLSISSLAMSRELAEGMGLTDGDEVMVWRDPILRDGGVRCLDIKIDDNLVGVAVNPVIAKSFDGDFDGDSVGIARPSTQRARVEARKLFGMEANLLDFGSKTSITIDGDEIEVYPLYFHESLDVKVSEHFAPELADRFARLTLEANDLYSDYESGDLSESLYLEKGREIVQKLDDFYADAFSQGAQGVTLRFDNAVDYLTSVKEACIDTGAKGSMSKLSGFASYLGVDFDEMVDKGQSLHTREEDQGVMVAVTVKGGVGIAGAYSQRGVKALRNVDVKAVTELTYPVTQAQLQAKHDSKEAMIKYEALMGPGRLLWKGRLMERGADGSWGVALDNNGREQQATPQQWVSSFIDMYTDSNSFGVSVNPEYVESVAKHLTGPDGLMVDIEDIDPKIEAGRGSVMDRLAYGGTWDTVMSVAQNQENLFDGKLTERFAPFVVRRNWKAMTEYENALDNLDDLQNVEDLLVPVVGPDVKQFNTKDVVKDGAIRGANKRSAIAQTVSIPRSVFQLETVASSTDIESEMER